VARQHEREARVRVGGTTVRWASDGVRGTRGQGASPGGAYDRSGEAE
jgi:hypothetical protein